MFCKIGDTIGYIRKSQKLGETKWKWELVKGEVYSLAIRKDGVHVCAESFRPLDDEEIRSNTEIISKRNGLILVQEPFRMDDEIKARVERWIDWMNESPENEKKATDFGLVEAKR